MTIYEGIIIKTDGEFHAAILKLSQGTEPCCDTVLERMWKKLTYG